MWPRVNVVLSGSNEKPGTEGKEVHPTLRLSSSPWTRFLVEMPSTSVGDQISGALRSNATCSICMDILAAPHRNFCGHAFCGACLASWAEKGARLRCPVCRKRLRDVCSDVALEGFIASLAETGLPEEEYSSFKERTGSWEEAKGAVYEAWVAMGIKMDSAKRSSFDSDTDASDDHDDRDLLYNDPNDFDVDLIDDDNLDILEVSSSQVLLEAPDNEEPVYQDANAHDWGCPVSHPDVEWSFGEHQETEDPDSDGRLPTDKEEPTIEVARTSGWISQLPDPSSEWSFGHQRETADPESDGATLTESDHGEPINEGWKRWELRCMHAIAELTVSTSYGTVDPESEGSPSRSSHGGYGDWEDQLTDPSVGSPARGGRFVAIEPDAPSAGASDHEQPENECGNHSDGGYSLLDPLLTFDEDQRFADRNSSIELPLTDLHEEDAAFPGVPSGWDSLSEHCLRQVWVENQENPNSTVDPDSDGEQPSDEESEGCSEEGCPPAGDDRFDGYSTSDNEQDSDNGHSSNGGYPCSDPSGEWDLGDHEDGEEDLSYGSPSDYESDN